MASQLPQHIAIIMDGNGRWAKSKGLPRLEGHRVGVEIAEEMITAVHELQIPFLTLYAFSEENWNRPTEEVDTLMGLLEIFLKTRQEKMINKGIRFRTIGDISKLPASVQSTIAETVSITKDGQQMTLILALSYGSRDEIVGAVNKIVQRTSDVGHRGEITEQEFAKCLDTADFPDPDLLIRTSGEYRLSNYLLWQLAYTELYFTKTMWPDFSAQELSKALEEYSKRERRFGKISEQL
ncbi:MAG: polyprenyl diphosphate synthase [Deltaproteobacteria bacterium]|nr:polyprenyl diphosphate synthase [Deltaproteobacteria bacterium]